METIQKTIQQLLPQEGYTAATTKTIPSRCKEKKEATVHIHYDFEECIAFFNSKGKELFGDHFRIHASDYEVIYKLLVYIIRDEERAKKYNIHLNKGLLLSGPIGCGKTSLMRLLNEFQPRCNRYAIRSCRDISFEFIKEGYEVIPKYSAHTAKRSTPLTYYFDDLGTESNLKYYGNECNVMGEILLSRYDLFVSQKITTHLSTNLTAQEIEMYYGNRVRSRMREMFNLIAFEGEVVDKRC